MTTPFGPAEEKKLTSALREAVTAVADGATPDAALAKAARDGGLHPDSLPLLVQAYNTGQLVHQRTKAADEGTGTAGLLAPYPLAHVDQVRTALYPATKAAQAPVAACYSVPPAPLAAYEAEKAAALAARPLPTQQPPARPAPEFLIAARQRAKQAAARLQDQLRTDLAATHDRVLASLDAVCGYFKQSASRRISLAEAEYNSARLLGPEARRVFDVVALRAKEARAQGVVPTTQPADLTAAPYALVKAALAVAEEYVREEQEVATLSAKLASEVAKLDPFAVVSGTQEESLLRDLEAPFWKKRKKEAGLLGNLMSGLTGGVAAVKSLPIAQPSELVESAADQLNDPGHLAELRKVNARAMLAGLMANDEVISGYDPDEVTNAYNEITQLSPTLATQGAAMRGLLRRQLTGGALDTHEVQQAAQVEQLLRRDQSAAPKPTATKK
jgi:hypothetical protein